MPSVRALTQLLNAMFIKEAGCNKAAFETCLSAVPMPINPLSIPPDYEHGRLKQCSAKSGCNAMYNTWSKDEERKFENGMQNKGMKISQNVEKLAMAYEKAYFQFAQRNQQNFGTVAAKYLEAEKSKMLQYGCKPECANKCTSNFHQYQECMSESFEHFPQW